MWRWLTKITLSTAAMVFYCANGYATAGEPYPVMLTKHLAQHLEYPESAKLYGLEGHAIVRMRVAKDGSLMDYAIVRSPGYSILDHALEQILEKADPFPAVPDEALEDGQNYADFMMPIAFQMETKKEDLRKAYQEFMLAVEMAGGPVAQAGKGGSESAETNPQQ